MPVHSGHPIQTYAGARETTLPGVDLQPGTLIAQYELIREIGHGGMGVVYAARDLKLGRRVAMKFLRTVDRDVIDRFLVEARATAQCNHDNIVIIYEVAEYDGMPYMVLELLEGVSLRDLMCMFEEGEPMPPARVIEVMLPVARGLARAHELGIVHRDLKPENVIVTTNGQVKVLDFGIAKALGNADGQWKVPTPEEIPDLALTNEGGIVGTLPYMSPEQMGVDQIDHRSDLFALGMIMFEMLAGRHPVEPLTSDALVANLVTSEPMRSVRSAVPDLPDPLVRIVDDCLRKPKAQRIANATELARRLEELKPGRHGRQLADGESPYPGLTAFQETDADRFFGRGRDVARMVARVRELPLTGIVGPSGVGKSSFIRAGVGPALKAGEPWDIVTLRPGRHPLAALASVIERFRGLATGNVLTDPRDHQMLIDRLRAEPGHLGALLRTRATESRSNVLLFVDQFEELYTLVPDVAERRAFTMALAAVADDSGAPLRVVVSMRSDFLDRVSEDARFMEELSRGLVFLSAPDRDGLREALEQPVEMLGFRFETTAMIDSMLDALATTPGALPLLQFAAAKLWDARDRDRRLLTAQSFAAIGGISGALATHADEVVRNMGKEAQRLTQRVFRQLVTPERTRAIVELSDVYQLSNDRAEITRVIDLLVAARLLVVQRRADLGGGSVELVHESLIDRWPMLGRWLDEDQEVAAFVAQLSTAAKQWEVKGRPAGLLWRGDAMEEARRWASQRPRSLGAREQAFLDAVLALARRGRRMKRIALVSSFVVLGAIAAGASVAYVRVSAAEQEATVALGKIQEQERRRSAAEQLRALAEADKQRAVDDKLKAVDDKLKAVDDKLKAEDEVKDKAIEVALTREELVQKNLELEGTVKQTKLARERAEAASKRAELSANEALAAKAELQVKLDAEKAHVRALEEEKRKLSTKLKE